MNNCGKRFHSEAAKFRFLNELIKVLTPKYFGAWTAQTVKDRVTEVLYGWTLWLKDEPKIQEAYKMLKKQSIVKKDPKLPDTVIMAPPSQRTTESVFDQEEKAKLLARLLNSGRPEDLETANRLIKSTIKEEQEKVEKVAKRESTLKEVESSTKQLRELLDQHLEARTSLQPSDDVKALYERCDRLRPSLFRLASDTMDDDAALAQILAANDELTLAVSAYKDMMARGEGNGGKVRSKSEEVAVPTSPREIKSYHLIDLSALDSPQTQRKADPLPAFESSSPLFSFFSEAEQDSEFDDLVSEQTQQNPKSYYEELIQLDKVCQKTEQNGGREVLLRARGCGGSSSTPNRTNIWSLPDVQKVTVSESKPKTNQGFEEKSSCSPQSLKNIFVPLEAIKSGHLEPITLYNRAGIHVSLHFARDSPSGHPGVAVVVMSAVNTSALEVKDFTFQVAVPKNMLVKLQPASRTHLPPYNPLLPPPAVSQVLLVSNPQSSKVRLRYKLTLTHGDQQLNETGEVDSFPDWNSLTKH
ncbi:ADP-ribosylation factor-binding protein GGA2-like isoform X2 [Kryptolebias marmoratus]|nr:ADP-ribosylation factor-binding protein GGA2-like isoform X2 [Kryptolebias marmoratus]